MIFDTSRINIYWYQVHGGYGCLSVILYIGKIRVRNVPRMFIYGEMRGHPWITEGASGVVVSYIKAMRCDHKKGHTTIKKVMAHTFFMVIL